VSKIELPFIVARSGVVASLVRPVAAVACLAVLAGCATGTVLSESHYGRDDFATVRKFDAHVHANVVAPEILDQARADGFELLTVNVDYPDFPSLGEQQAAALALVRLDPARLHFATTFSMEGWGQPDWATRANGQIDAAVAQGALAVKVWKNIGMDVRGKDGRLVMIDDPGFDPVLAHVQALGLPLIGHQGEPYNCWLPLDRMTTENDRSYFREHPQYHMYLHPELPSYEQQMSARDRMLDHHPGLRFIGAHMASLEWDVDRLGAFLDAHPGAVIDLAARMTQVQYQSHRDRERVRGFFIRYQDRILYGSDLTFAPDAAAATFRTDAHAAWTSDWVYLATDEVQRVDDIDADVKGLQLPRAVIDSIYYGNARRVLLDRRPAGH
jgi:predicted TIM-barrel fold metal-dependent hydrolase